MKIHDDIEQFNVIVHNTSLFTGFSESIIVKDYYAMMILEKVTSELPELIFKGGTSLSKAYKAIDRFSEDLDLTCNFKPTEGKRRSISHTIQKCMDDLGLKIKDVEYIKSKSDHNIYYVVYPHNEVDSLGEFIEIETSYYMEAFPHDRRELKTYILEYLESEGLEEIINEYDLHSFWVNVQTIERTYVDKVFALCDYYIRNSINKRARHIYDLYKLYPSINFNNDFKKLVNDVRILRRGHEKCESAQVGVNINDVLKEIIDYSYFRTDYNNVTKPMLAPNEEISYEEALTVLQKIIDTKTFE